MKNNNDDLNTPKSMGGKTSNVGRRGIRQGDGTARDNEDSRKNAVTDGKRSPLKGSENKLSGKG